VDWVELAEDGKLWRAFLNMVMNLRFHKILGSYSIAA
jgi:hypothetical protein